jgi:hypothetical protein
MFSSKTCRFVVFSFLSLSANAATVRGVAHRELTETRVELGTAGTYAILTQAGISTSAYPNPSNITGNIGVTPITGAAMTGFNLVKSDDKVSSTDDAQIIGAAYASDYAEPTPTNLIQAKEDMKTAYADAASRTTTVDPSNPTYYLNRNGGNIGGLTLTAGVYTFGTSVSINSDLHFSGISTDIFIIQIAGGLTQAANVQVTLINGAKAENIFWQVAGAATVGADSHLDGILLVATAVTFGNSASLNGRILAQTRCNLDQNTIDSTELSVVI